MDTIKSKAPLFHLKLSGLKTGKRRDREMELFEQIAGVVDAQNEAVMSGLELGREESAARIKKLEATNAELVKMLKGMIDIHAYTRDDAEAMRDAALELIKEAEE